MNQSKSKLRSIYSLLILVILIGLGTIVYIQRQSVRDWFILLTYKPPQTIQTIANEDGMTSYTRRVFYVNHPQIVSRSNFSQYCPNSSEQSVVLGCYHTGQNGIFILAVNNPDLYGLEQETAAYETLHAIYQRLSTAQQKTLNSELISFENHGLNNSTVEDQIAGFRKTEPTGVLNEVTSLFGTEVQNLPPDLTKFYAKYFTNRQILLNYYNDYQGAFNSRINQINSLDSQLSSLKSQIDSNESTLNTELGQINSQQSTLNSERNSGETSQYNQAVVSYNQQVDTYNSLVGTVKSEVNQYNQLVDERNSIALEEDQLVQDISAPPVAITNSN